MKFFGRVFLKWLPFAVLAAGLCGLVYVAVQQSLRISGNDPQIQIAEDTASALAAGTNPNTFMTAQKVDLAKSLAPFIITFDDTGSAKTSSAQLNGQTPSVPQGVLDNARQNGENRVTWQPENGVRIAAVVAPYPGGFVLAGRSLLEIEKREDQAQFLSVVAMLAIWVATFVLLGLVEILQGRLEISTQP